MDVQRTTDSLRGQFLISTPVIESGFFKSTVTYICEHGEAGAMGIVINKPLDLQLADIFEHLNIQPLLSHDEVAVLAGGPVKVDRGFVLHSPGVTYDATLELRGPLALLDPLLGIVFDRIGDKAAAGLIRVLDGAAVA